MELRAEQPLNEQFDRYLRNYNDTATWLAETLDGSMLTPFTYTFDGRELYADDGSPLADIFLDSLTDARRNAREHPEQAFEIRRRQYELAEYGDMLKMARGELPNTMIVVSDFPPELMTARRDVGGYNVTRRQTMLRVLAWDGQKLHMYSQSLDGSNRPALEAIYTTMGSPAQPGELLGQRLHQQIEPEEQRYLTSRLTGVYDRSLQHQTGGQWHAGRRDTPHDTYQFVLSQHEVLDHFASRYLQHSPTNEDRYNLAALMEKRFEAFKRPSITISSEVLMFNSLGLRNLEWQLQEAGSEARAEGKTFSGCGISVGASSPAEQLKRAGYGNQSAADEDKLGSRTFMCPKGHENYRYVPNVKVTSCQKCGIDVSCEAPKTRPKPKTKLTWKTLIGLELDTSPPKKEAIRLPKNLGQQALVGSAR